MTGVSPGSLLTFILDAYRGRTSGKAIFEGSKIINLLEPHIDSIMVDKGFLIDKNNNFIKIIRPYFLRKQK